jgi:hypothetical protein
MGLSVESLLQKKHVLWGECATSDIAISSASKVQGMGDLRACTHSLGMAVPWRQKIVGKPNAAAFMGMTHVSRV